jgi:sugar lactone lactonase YvrE
MIMSFIIALIVAIFAVGAVLGRGDEDKSPYVVFQGFSWAENLAFDGNGGLFVSDAVKGELWKIHFNETSAAYDGNIFLKAGATQFGGLAVTPDGLHIYAGAVLDDDSMAIIKASTVIPMKFDIIIATPHLANGLAADFKRGVLYFTDEGVGEGFDGGVTSLNLKTLEMKVAANVKSADGCFFDSMNDKLFVGELVSKKVSVFSVSDAGLTFDSSNVALSEGVNSLHIMDDLTLDQGLTNMENVNKTVLFGADWTGRKIQRFTLDGSSISEVPVPEDVKLKEPTSVRWGKGAGFDSNSLYVSEGGGATKLEHGRRIIRIPMA